MKSTPDFDIELSQAIDYIMESPIAKKAFEKPPFAQYTNVLRSLIQSIDRLADNCHMPEFTNHALPHICSIVCRASEWAVEDKWLTKIEEREAGYLLLALIVHDIGMLSQDASDLPEENKTANMKGFADISNWVRRTHVIRIEGLVKRLLKEALEKDETLGIHLEVVIGMAASHQKWVWEDGFVSHLEAIQKLGLDVDRIAAMNAVIAVCDLLDEDSSRCDTVTLIKYRHGTMENMAHWIRHALTAEVKGVQNHTVTVSFRKLLPSEEKHEKIYRALRNHYKLVRLYNEQLKVLGAEIEHLEFQPSDGIPEYADEMAEELSSVLKSLLEFKGCITEQILSTFMPEALNQDGKDLNMRKRLDAIGLETISLSEEQSFIEPGKVCYPEEKVLLVSGNFKEQLTYLKQMVEEAYLDGNIGKVRHLAYIAWKKWKQKASLNEVYWIYTFLSIFQKYGDECLELTAEYDNYFTPDSLKRSCNKVIIEGDYSHLLDVWFQFLRPQVNDIYLKKYESHLLECNYEYIHDDLASELLFENVIGMFWYYDPETEHWRKVGDHFVACLKTSAPLLANRVEKYVKQLQEQNAILYRTQEQTGYIKEQEQSVFAKAWKDFWNEDWVEIEADIPVLCKIANRNRDYQETVQGFLNMVRWSIEIAKSRMDKRERNTLSGAHKQEDSDERAIGRYRYSRIQLEQPLPSYWQQRNLIIHSLLGECQNHKNAAVSERYQLIRLISFQVLDALRYWNLGGYLEAIHNETRLYYLLATYTDENGQYCGEMQFLTECFISYIRGISEKELNEEELQTAAQYLVQYERKGLERIVTFITEQSVRIQWKCALYVVTALAEYFSDNERKRLLHWLVRYHAYYKEQGRFFDLKQYQFIHVWALKMEKEDWEEIAGLLDEIFSDQHIYMINTRLVESIFENNDWEKCIEYVEQMKQYPDNVRKSADIYQAIIILSQRDDADRNALHKIVRELIRQMEAIIHAKEDAEQTDEIVEKEFVVEQEEEDSVEVLKRYNRMLQIYKDLDGLIDVDSLYELKPVDLNLIKEAMNGLYENIKKRGRLSGYDSELFDFVKEAFCNKNWSGAEENSVIKVIDTIFAWMETYRYEMSFMFFHDFCQLLGYIIGSGSEKIRKYITALVVEKFVHVRFLTKGKNDAKDGPLNRFQIKMGSTNQYEIETTLLLVKGLIDIATEHQPDVISYMIAALQTDEPIIYQYATVMFSYYYLTKTEMTHVSAWGGLLYIQGRLVVQNKKEIRENVKFAINAMEESTNWFGEKGYQEYVNEDQNYNEWKQKVTGN